MGYKENDQLPRTACENWVPQVSPEVEIQTQTRQEDSATPVNTVPLNETSPLEDNDSIHEGNNTMQADGKLKYTTCWRY